MSPDKARKIYRNALICLVLIIASFLLPRLLNFSGDGFAPAASAVMVFIGCLVATLVFALRLLVITLNAYRDLPVPARLAGIAPAALIASGLVFLIVFLTY